jgi:hypothetical protein
MVVGRKFSSRSQAFSNRKTEGAGIIVEAETMRGT